MNQFEFLRSVPIGQYLPTGSPVHRLDPRTRLVVYVALILGLTLTPHLPGILLGLAVVLIGLGLARIPYRFVINGLLPPLPFIVFLMALQIILSPAPPGAVVFAKIWIIDINSADLLASIILLCRFIALILALGLVSYTLSTSEMISGLNRLLGPIGRLGLPVQDFAMVVQVTFRFLPLLAQAAERVAKAQASRGVDWDSRQKNPLKRVRQMFPLFIPLFLISLRRAENMALAMDARAYGSSPVRTSLSSFHFQWKDGLTILMVAGLIAAIVLL
jgi:energy-coupling factor transport system permease protein